MRLPVIKNLVEFIENNDEDFLHETIDVLESVSEAKGIKDEEMEVIGELMSNMFGAIEVHQAIKSGKTQKEALNDFMQRVMGAIDKG